MVVVNFINLFIRLISNQPAVLFSQNRPATSNQPAVLFSQNKSATSQTNRLHNVYSLYLELKKYHQYGAAIYSDPV
jgi:hypothetical protein